MSSWESNFKFTFPLDPGGNSVVLTEVNMARNSKAVSGLSGVCYQGDSIVPFILEASSNAWDKSPLFPMGLSFPFNK